MHRLAWTRLEAGLDELGSTSFIMMASIERDLPHMQVCCNRLQPQSTMYLYGALKCFFSALWLPARALHTHACYSERLRSRWYVCHVCAPPFKEHLWTPYQLTSEADFVRNPNPLRYFTHAVVVYHNRIQSTSSSRPWGLRVSILEFLWGVRRVGE